ncbi:MAG TPA: 23S rRNA (uracil(1939)-C(5))-methyltransferase RlmD, partial [Methylomirabilota bacterium]|nr:23S rRNA (uracil(1939)-C(5))-methyltransferase RlmD [Methylomirabilota bacterium]
TRAQRGDRLTVDVTDLAFGGEGVARAGGFVVFVPGGVPGDRLEVRLTQVRPRFAHGEIVEVLTRSGLRTDPPCPYFGRCGGCRLQHVRYEAQLEFKQRQVAECLARLGGLGPAVSLPIRPIIGAPEIYGYRNKMEFTVARGDAAERVVPKGRRLSGPDGPGQPAVVVGLHEADRYDAVLDVERCLLQSDRMNALLEEARLFFTERRLTVYDQESGEGLLRFLMLREGKRTGEAMVNVVTSAPAVSELEPLVGRAQARVPETSSVVLNVNPKKASVAVGVEEHLLGGRDHIRESLGDLTFQVSAGSFFQTNTVQAERLFGLVLDAAALTGQETVVDLYSGTGAISLLLARRCRHVYGIEVAPAAVADAVRNAEVNGITNCSFVAGEVRF